MSNKIHVLKKLWVSCFSLLIVFTCQAQDVQLKLLDEVSLTPIRGVNIYCKDNAGNKGGARSADNGLAVLTGFKFPMTVTFSVVSYKKDTVILTQNNMQWKNYGYYKTFLLKNIVSKFYRLPQGVS